MVRNTISEMAVNVEVSYMLSYQIAYIQSKGEVPNKEASMGKSFGTEVEQRIMQMSMGILGLYGQLTPSSPRTPLHGWVENNYLKSVSDTIQSGTSEIQRNIIATRGLGLPRQ